MLPSAAQIASITLQSSLHRNNIETTSKSHSVCEDNRISQLAKLLKSGQIDIYLTLMPLVGHRSDIAQSSFVCLADLILFTHENLLLVEKKHRNSEQDD